MRMFCDTNCMIDHMLHREYLQKKTLVNWLQFAKRFYRLSFLLYYTVANLRLTPLKTLLL